VPAHPHSEQQSPDAFARAEQLFKTGDFAATASILEGVEQKKKHIWRRLLQCYAKTHRFEELLSTYEAMPAEVQKDTTCRYLYVSAAANLQRPEVVEKAVEAALQEPDEDTAAFLCKVFPIAARLAPETSATITERILTHATELAATDFDSLLMSAHNFAEAGLEGEATELEGALEAAAVDAKATAKLKVFQGQRHFLAGRYGLQLVAINEVLAEQSLDPVALMDEEGAFECDNLKAAAVGRSVHGPLVSILMPAYNSAQTIAYALESLRCQTYRDFEVIVVDDASSDETTDIVAQFCAGDPRFRLIPLPTNSGAFIARNTALAAAVGEYVTNQDADDWAHPQKIAVEVAELEGDDSIVATWVNHIRCSHHRGFRVLSGYIRPDASSLMFRRVQVLERMGWYDSVRAAGDGEFYFRMRQSFGAHSIRQLNKLLSFVSWSEASLSGGGPLQIDSDLGILGRTRSAYIRSFGLWHETAERLYMPFPMSTRPFPAPDALIASQAFRSP
jgi:hypothetical protein